MHPEVIEKYRKKNKLKGQDICAALGKTPGWYSKIKKGVSPLKSQYIPLLAELFGIKPEKLAREYFSGDGLEDSSKFSA